MSDLKAAISAKVNAPPIDKQKLVYKGRTMQDSQPISIYNLEENCKVHLMVQKDSIKSSHPPSQPSPLIANQNRLSLQGVKRRADRSPVKLGPRNMKLDALLREKLTHHLPENVVEKIVTQVHQDIHNDIQSLSLDDLERLAKRRLGTQKER